MAYDPKQMQFYAEAVFIRNSDDGTLQQLVAHNGEVLLDLRDMTFAATTNSVAPAITPASGVTGDTLTCSTGTWTHRPLSYTYQWYRDGVAINGATAATHVCVVADVSKPLTCKVAATNRAGAASAVESSNSVTPTAP